jgi:hypothetical protein
MIITPFLYLYIPASFQKRFKVAEDQMFNIKAVLNMLAMSKQDELLW